MSEGTEILNQNEFHQNMGDIASANSGAMHNLVKQANNGVDITKIQPSGGEQFSLVADMAFEQLAGSLISFAVTAYEAFSDNGGSSFFTPPSDGQDKRSHKLTKLKSTNDGLGLPKSYTQKRKDANNFSKLQSGRANTSKDPMAGGNSTVDLMGNKIKRKKPAYLTLAMLQQNPVAYGPAAKKYSQNMAQAKRIESNPSSGNIIIGVGKGHADATAQAKNIFGQAMPEKHRTKIAARVKPRALLTKEDLGIGTDVPAHLHSQLTRIQLSAPAMG